MRHLRLRSTRRISNNVALGVKTVLLNSLKIKIIFSREIGDVDTLIAQKTKKLNIKKIEIDNIIFRGMAFCKFIFLYNL